MRDLEHPEITWALKTGYPSWNQPNEHKCEECGCELYSDEMYKDEYHDCICEECLLILHRVNPWE